MNIIRISTRLSQQYLTRHTPLLDLHLDIFAAIHREARYAFSLTAIPIAMLNELTQLAVLQLLSGADYLSVFTTEQLQALVCVFLRLHSLGLEIAQIFCGLWPFPMGYLVFKSGFLPRIVGVLLIIGCFGYIIQSFATFLGYNVSIIFFSGWGELLFLLWLLIKGVNVEQWEKRALESA